MKMNKRVLSLDILRGICIMIVLIHHVSIDSIPNIPELTGVSGFIFWKIRGLGWSGVDLFFVLSGFLIGGLLLSELEQFKKINIKRFLLRRGLKIWPSYYLLIVVLALFGATNWIREGDFSEQLTQVIVHVLYLQNYFDIGTNGPTWSLTIEEHFYTILPFLILAIYHFSGKVNKNLKALPIVMSIIIIMIIANRFIHSYNVDDLKNHFMLSHFRFDSLLAGVVIQYFYRNNKEKMKTLLAKHQLTLFSLAFLCVIPSMFWGRNTPFMFTLGFALLTLGYGLILSRVICHGFGSFESTYAAKALAHIGCWSYNIYLWHFFLPKLFKPFYEPIQIAISNISTLPEIVLLIQAAFYIGLSILVGYLATVIIEKPFLKLRSRYVPQGFKPNVI
ncbi:Putative acyltransferase [Lentisphaera araneosa HTCC2155]|uniref:Putative acyltransferase n=1 Tax=Lentisphaera araneosa HTCC2155 TaxID=313628 RepID=A6DP23_9BACT|nr:acyltransferase [Lentisphaera araneosa]EDM26555.1 Putative acyltransferase [Lentisphaera araneosa HTCC2155]